MSKVAAMYLYFNIWNMSLWQFWAESFRLPDKLFRLQCDECKGEIMFLQVSKWEWKDNIRDWSWKHLPYFVTWWQNRTNYSSYHVLFLLQIKCYHEIEIYWQKHIQMFTKYIFLETISYKYNQISSSTYNIKICLFHIITRFKFSMYLIFSFISNNFCKFRLNRERRKAGCRRMTRKPRRENVEQGGDGMHSMSAYFPLPAS